MPAEPRVQACGAHGICHRRCRRRYVSPPPPLPRFFLVFFSFFWIRPPIIVTRTNARIRPFRCHFIIRCKNRIAPTGQYRNGSRIDDSTTIQNRQHGDGWYITRVHCVYTRRHEWANSFVGKLSENIFTFSTIPLNSANYIDDRLFSQECEKK